MIARAMLGVVTPPSSIDRITRAVQARSDRLARRAERSLSRARISLITGPSGSGKSMLLRAWARHLEASGRRVERVDPRELPRGQSLIDAMHRYGPGDASLQLKRLATAGLVEVELLTTPVDRLSEGQRWRAAVARGVATAGSTGAVLVIDECGSTLDRTTACCVARTIHRWAFRDRVRIIAATSHDDLLETLAPDGLVVLDLNGQAIIASREIQPPSSDGPPVDRRSARAESTNS